MDWLEDFIEGLKLIPRYLPRFTKKVFSTFVLYGLFIVFPLLFGYGAALLIDHFFQNVYIARLIGKILFTIGQVIPLSFSLLASESDNGENGGYSTELCYAMCLFSIAYIWQ